MTIYHGANSPEGPTVFASTLLVRDLHRAAPPAEKTVDIWSVDLSTAGKCIDALAGTLSDTEKERSAALVFARHRRRFVASHAALRLVLAAYCGRSPSALRFTEKQGEKPRLCSEQASRRIEFNLSHSGERAVIAVASGKPVGVDIEAICEAPPCDEAIKRCFSPGEHERLMRIPPEERQSAFLSLWTRKEAYIKAIGRGLAVPLDTFEVELCGNRRARVHSLTGCRVATGWWVYPLALEHGYIGTLAVPGEGWTLNRRTLDLEGVLQKHPMDVR